MTARPPDDGPPDPFDRIAAPRRPRRTGGASTFDRIKPPERRVAERPEGDRLDAPDADRQGRAALFTHSQRRGTPVTVHCSRCTATSPVDAATALRSALPLVLLAPWRDHPVFAVCPACRRRSWLRPGIGG